MVFIDGKIYSVVRTPWKETPIYYDFHDTVPSTVYFGIDRISLLQYQVQTTDVNPRQDFFSYESYRKSSIA